MNDVNVRLKQIRNDLHLSQEEFGGKIGITKAAISRLEKGINNMTERTMRAVCREFNVSYVWLSTGIGEPFKQMDEQQQIMATIDSVMFGEDTLAKSVFSAFAKLDVEAWRALETLLKSMDKDLLSILGYDPEKCVKKAPISNETDAEKNSN